MIAFHRTLYPLARRRGMVPLPRLLVVLLDLPVSEMPAGTCLPVLRSVDPGAIVVIISAVADIPTVESGLIAPSTARTPEDNVASRSALDAAGGSARDSSLPHHRSAAR